MGYRIFLMKKRIFFLLLAILTFISILWQLDQQGQFDLIFTFTGWGNWFLLIWFIVSVFLVFLWIISLFPIGFFSPLAGMGQGLGTLVFYLIFSLLVIVSIRSGFTPLWDPRTDISWEELEEDLVCQPDRPCLLIKLKNYPERLKYSCDIAKINLEVKNVGEETLLYQDLVAGEVGLCIYTAKGTEVDCTYNGLSRIDKFGPIEPGGVEEVTYIAGYNLELPQGFEPGKIWKNVFHRLANGTYEFTVVLRESPANSLTPLVLSQGTAGRMILDMRQLANPFLLKPCLQY